eukprot:395327_1
MDLELTQLKAELKPFFTNTFPQYFDLVYNEQTHANKFMMNFLQNFTRYDYVEEEFRKMGIRKHKHTKTTLKQIQQVRNKLVYEPMWCRLNTLLFPRRYNPYIRRRSRSGEYTLHRTKGYENGISMEQRQNENFEREFKTIKDYKKFLCSSDRYQKDYLLLLDGYIRQKINSSAKASYDLLILLYCYVWNTYANVMGYATFKFYVLFIPNYDAKTVININNKKQLELMILSDNNINYEKFIELIYKRFDLFDVRQDLTGYRQLNYYQENNISNFDVQRFLWDGTNKFKNTEWNLLRHQICIYFTPKVTTNEVIHSVYVAGQKLQAKGPFPIIFDKKVSNNEIIKKSLKYWNISNVDDEKARFFHVQSINKNHNGSLDSRRIQVEMQRRS